MFRADIKHLTSLRITEGLSDRRNRHYAIRPKKWVQHDIERDRLAKSVQYSK